MGQQQREAFEAAARRHALFERTNSHRNKPVADRKLLLKSALIGVILWGLIIVGVAWIIA